MPQKPVAITANSLVGLFLVDKFLAFLTKLYCRENFVSLFACLVWMVFSMLLVPHRGDLSQRRR